MNVYLLTCVHFGKDFSTQLNCLPV